MKGKHLALRAVLFGVGTTVALFMVCLMLFLVLESLHVGQPSAWPLLLFVAPGMPLAWLLERIPSLSLDWVPWSDGHGGAVMVLFYLACAAWMLIFAVLRYSVLARRVHAPAVIEPSGATQAPDPDIIAAHKHCSNNRAELERSDMCGCFYCLSIYPPSEIREWVDWPEGTPADLELESGTTALCARCEIDAVIGSASGYTIDTAFLTVMEKHWFSGLPPAVTP